MNNLDWLDVLEIAIELNDKFPEIDPQWISSVSYTHLTLPTSDLV